MMNIEDLISQYLDGTLSSEAEAELHHRLSVSPDARKIFRAQIALQGVARDPRVLQIPTVQMRTSLFDRLQREEGMGALTDSATPTPSQLASSLMEPATAPPKPRFAPPNRPAVRSELATNPEPERRRRRLAAVLLPLLVLVVASGIVWQRGGFGGNEAGPSLASNNAMQDTLGIGSALPQTAPQSGNGASSSAQAEPTVTEKIGEELLAINQPPSHSAIASRRETRVAFSGSSGAEARHDYTTTAMDAMASESTSASGVSGTVEDEGDAIAAASHAADESELSGGVSSSFDDDRTTATLKLDANDGTVVLDGSGHAAFLPTTDTTQNSIRDLLAEGEQGIITAPESPLDRGEVLSNAGGGLTLMGSTATISMIPPQPDSGIGGGEMLASAAPPPPPIAADLHNINPRGMKSRGAITPSTPSEELPAMTVAEKAEGSKQLAKVPKTKAGPARRVVIHPSQKGVATASSHVRMDDILGLSANRLTFTELATKRLLASNAMAHNAQLQLSFDTLTIQGTLVQQGKRTRGGTQLRYEVVGGKVVIDISTLPTEQRQQLQEYLRKLGKAE